LSDYLKSIAGWNLDGSLGLHWMERDMANGAASVSGYATARCASQHPTQARFLRLTFDANQIILKVGPGDHTVDEWQIDKNQLRSLILDGLPWLLK